MRVFAVFLTLDLRLLVHGEQIPALDIHERGGHDQELARDFQVQQPHGFDVFDELRRQAEDGQPHAHPKEQPGRVCIKTREGLLAARRLQTVQGWGSFRAGTQGSALAQSWAK